ncbi:potassium-transporting ATPase subunit KdpC [Acinetobacter sp. 3657]|uniref:potassium-transporting ATPase subunit KdpC n=1 Tax=Acinetobacter sp. 3657 TaxID=2817764 RepID=UPI0028604044|nr:K+-transporting ATPase ATPase C chain [Prolinoborus sp. 3657]
MNTLENLPSMIESQSLLRPSLGLIMVGFLIAGVLYCSASVSIAQLIFPTQANGSLITTNGKIVGSSLVGQSFVSDRYFHARPSAIAYDAFAVGGSNLAVSNPEFHQQIKERTAQFAQYNHTTAEQVPNEMITASGSGIDPDISPESALLQVKRVAEQHHLAEQQVTNLVKQHIQPAQWGIYGQARVNVLQLNLALDQLSSTPR